MRVLVVEDDPSIGHLLRHVFERDGQDIVHASTATMGLQVLRDWNPDVVVLDIGLPDLSGFDVTRKIRSESDVPIVILTARGQESDRVTGLDLGADDYVVKPFSVTELAARVRAVARRHKGELKSVVGDSILKLRDLVFESDQHRVLRGNTEIQLTKREFEILRMLIQQPGQIISRSAISHALWGRTASTAKNVLDVHMSSLRKKLVDKSDQPEYIETVRGEGFRLIA
jgi:DNA-binding response OmpR family regulator